MTMNDDLSPDERLESVGERIRWVIEEHLGVTHTEFARRLGVKPPQHSRWINRPDSPPSEPYLERIAGLGSVPVAWLRYGKGEVKQREEDEISAEDLFRHFEGMVRRMGGADVAPEELRLRKLDVVDGLTRLYAAQGTVPGWIYELKGRILRDEI
jgi:hypothetical protein